MFVIVSRAQPTKSRDILASPVAIQKPLDEVTLLILSEFSTFMAVSTPYPSILEGPGQLGAFPVTVDSYRSYTTVQVSFVEVFKLLFHCSVSHADLVCSPRVFNINRFQSDLPCTRQLLMVCI